VHVGIATAVGPAVLLLAFMTVVSAACVAISVSATADVVKTDSFTLSPVAEAAVCRTPADVNAPEGLSKILVKLAVGAAKPNEFASSAAMFPVPATTETLPGAVPFVL